MSFTVVWLVAVLGLVLLTAWAGRLVRFEDSPKSFFGALLDARQRFSLNRLQILMWTILVLSTMLAILVTNFETAPGSSLAIPQQLLALMGISAGSATLAGAVKDGKNATRPQKIVGGEAFRARIAANLGKPVEDMMSPQTPSFSQVLLEEEGADGNERVISVTKFQNLIISAVVALIYIVLTLEAKGYPTLDNNFLWLVGISHAGYIGGKLPNKE
ncbi:MAG: hypothetical protein AAF604_15005 [Acidobacteriota bacterium]